jgi:hypothetical protein
MPDARAGVYPLRAPTPTHPTRGREPGGISVVRGVHRQSRWLTEGTRWMRGNLGYPIGESSR